MRFLGFLFIRSDKGNVDLILAAGAPAHVRNVKPEDVYDLHRGASPWNSRVNFIALLSKLFKHIKLDAWV